MKLMERKSVNFVRIQIGNCKTGLNGLTKPIKTVNVSETTVDEIYNKILKMIKDGIK